MALKIGNSSIKGIYLGDTKVKSVYLGDKLIYGNKSEIVADDSYNIFVFDTSKVSTSTTVELSENRAGDTTDWDGLTDWGDGIIDNDEYYSHRYASDGIYTVKTKYIWYLNNEESHTKKMLIECTNINKNITNYYRLFMNCINLTSVSATNFNTSKATNMTHMFYRCLNLTSLDLSSFDTSSVTTMVYMFMNCTNLMTLNISNWNMDNVTNVANMFTGCNKLTIDNIIMTNCNDATKAKIQEALAAK